MPSKYKEVNRLGKEVHILPFGKAGKLICPEDKKDIKIRKLGFYLMYGLKGVSSLAMFDFCIENIHLWSVLTNWWDHFEAMLWAKKGLLSTQGGIVGRAEQKLIEWSLFDCNLSNLKMPVMGWIKSTPKEPKSRWKRIQEWLHGSLKRPARQTFQRG